MDVITELVTNILNEAVERSNKTTYDEDMPNYIYIEVRKMLKERIDAGLIDDNELDAFLAILA